MLDKLSDEKPALIFQGTIGSFRTIPSRGVVSVTVEAPIEFLEVVARVAVHNVHVAVARIQPPAEEPKHKRNWNDLPPASQAALLCKDPEFWLYIKADNEEAAIEHIYVVCGVESRAQLSTDDAAGERWERLVEQFRVWQRARA